MKRYIRSSGLPKLNYDASANMYRSSADLEDALERFFFNSTLKRLGSRNGVEYGISGQRRSRGRANNSKAGWIGYKIDNGVAYIARFNPTNTETAEKWLREALRDPDYEWIPVGEI